MYAFDSEEYRSHYRRLLSGRLDSENEPYIFLSPEWCSVFEKKIQNDQRYKHVARNWEGSVVLGFLADPEAGFERDRYVFLDLWHGECNSLQLVPESIGRTGDFVLQTEYGNWVKIIKGELNVVKELATRKLKLVPFDIKKAMKLAGASQAALRLVELAGTAGARFTGELGAEEETGFQVLSEKLSADFGI